MMESYGIRSVSKFNIEGTKIEVTRTENSTIIVGEILKTDSSIKIGNIEFTIFNCKYFKEKKSDIIVDGNPFTEFKEVNPFKIYYSSKEKLLIANSSIGICTPFLKYLKQSNPELVSYSGIDFDFVKIVRNKALVDQVWFSTSDTHARTKSFNGVRVDKNKEAMKAISDGKASFIKVQIDVASNGQNKKRTIGFSKKSGLTIFRNNDPSIDDLQKKLQLFLDAYNTYGSFK